jgi:hypothetical protein
MADAAEGTHGLPVALTSFVGRAQAVGEIAVVQDPAQVPAVAATALGIGDLPSVAAADAPAHALAAVWVMPPLPRTKPDGPPCV